MISTLLDRLFQRSNVPSGAKVKQRLKFILAHDRAAIEPKVFENMRHEIMRVVSKYVELDEGALDIRLESDKRMTALIANLPIRMVREEMPDLDELFSESNDKSNLVIDVEPSSVILEMDRSAEEALDAIAARESIKSIPESVSLKSIDLENIAVIAVRTTEVTDKLRTAANKTQTAEVSDRPEFEQPITLPNSITDPFDGSNSINSDEKSSEQPSDQSDQLELPLASTSHEVVIEESPELYNQA